MHRPSSASSYRYLSLALAVVMGGPSCSGGPPDEGEPGAVGRPEIGGTAGVEQEGSVSDTSVIEAQEALTPIVLELPGVVGTGVGLCDGAPCIQVLVATADSSLLAQLPERFRGFSVDVQVVGEIRAQDTTDTGSESSPTGS